MTANVSISREFHVSKIVSEPDVTYGVDLRREGKIK
jgi:hypothetical protein